MPRFLEEDGNTDGDMGDGLAVKGDRGCPPCHNSPPASTVAQPAYENLDAVGDVSLSAHPWGNSSADV